jgi:hypothetical protein
MFELSEPYPTRINRRQFIKDACFNCSKGLLKACKDSVRYSFIALCATVSVYGGLVIATNMHPIGKIPIYIKMN